MSNREKLINLQRRFEKDARSFADKEDYISFKKIIEDFIVEAGKLNPDINTRDLLSRHLSKASKVKSYSDALQVMNSISSDITILSMDLHGKGEPIFVASEYDKLVRDNNIEYTKNRFEVLKKSFDLLKKNNSDRFSKIDDLRSLYLGNVKNYKDKVFKFPHLVDTEQRKLFNTLKDIITKQVFDTFEKDREILLSYLSEIAEIGKAYVDRNVDFSDRLLDGYNIQKRREVIGESVDTEKLRRDLDKSNEKNIDNLLGSIKKCFESYVKGVENLMSEHSKLYNDRIERTRAERVILGGQDEVKGIIERYKKQLEDIITSGLSEDEEIFYSILGELKNFANESNDPLYEDRESLEKINDVFDTFKGEVNELLGDFEDDMKDNFEDEFKKLLEKLDSRFHDIMSSDDYVAFDKEEKVISSMFIDYCDELNVIVAGCLNAFKSNCINASNRFKAGMISVRSLTDREIVEQDVKRFIDSILIMVKNIERSKSFSKEYEKKYKRSFEEIINNHIWNGDMQFASGSEKLEKHLRNLLFKDDIFSMGVTSDILKNIALSVNGVDISKDKLLTRVKSVDLVRESKQRLLDKVERYGESYKEVAEHSILPIFYNLRNDAKSITDPSILKKNFISYIEKAENGGTYSRYNKFKDISDTARKLAKDFQKEKWVYRSFFVKHNEMIEKCIEDFLSAYEKGDYHNEKWRYPYDDWYKDRNFYRVVDVELSNAYYKSVKDHEVSGGFRYKGYSTVMDESDSISENRRDTFFEAEEDKKPKISKEEKEKLKAQLDNFFADKKEAKATELKKSITDRDKAIEDVILKYSTEKEKIQREYSKNIQAAKSEAEANKLRAERDEELQRLSLEKATSIEDLKERQKKEEASIREKYQTLFDKKLEEYKDSLGDTIHDFVKDIERGIENGIKSNPIFQ